MKIWNRSFKRLEEFSKRRCSLQSGNSYESEEENMLERVGVVKKRSFSLEQERARSFVNIARMLSRETSIEDEDQLARRMENLERKVQELEKERESRIKLPLKTDLVYSKFQNELEKKYFGKIVAIDIETETIAGIGNSILDAYSDAKKKTRKEQFSYRKVGSTYVHRL